MRNVHIHNVIYIVLIFLLLLKGGIIVNVTRREYLNPGGYLEHLNATCDKWEEEGKWKKIEIVLPKELKCSLHYEAIVMVYQVCWLLYLGLHV